MEVCWGDQMVTKRGALSSFGHRLGGGGGHNKKSEGPELNGYRLGRGEEVAAN